MKPVCVAAFSKLSLVEESGPFWVPGKSRQPHRTTDSFAPPRMAVDGLRILATQVLVQLCFGAASRRRVGNSLRMDKAEG